MSQAQVVVAEAIGVAQNVISRIRNRFLEILNRRRRPGQGRRHAISRIMKINI